MKTYMANPAKVEKKWYVVDAEGQTLGRLASEVAKVLRGKNKPEFTPFVDTGDYVIVINAEKIVVSGKKMEQKLYHTHSAYVGGFKTATLKEMIEKKPEKVVELAVAGMLPKGPLGREMYTKASRICRSRASARSTEARSIDILIGSVREEITVAKTKFYGTGRRKSSIARV